MPDLTAFQYPPPGDWQAFERLCHKLWREVWNDPQALMHGRSGQPQHGVDVYGKPPQATRHSGVQCKGKDGRYGHQVTEDELREEVEKAKSFSPVLGEWILATTAERDAKIQAVAREISEAHQAHGLFSVTVLAWDDIVSLLNRYRQVATEAGLPGAIVEAELGPQSERKLIGAIDGMRTAQEQTLQAVQILLERQVQPVEGALDAQIDGYRDLIVEHEPRTALKQLQRFRERQWDQAGARVRFRVLTNISACHLALAEYEKAAEYSLLAYACEPSSDKAAGNRAIAYVLLNRMPEALAAAKEAIELHPQSPAAWHAYITVGAKHTPPLPIPQVPESVQEHVDVLLALHQAFRAHGDLPSAEGMLRKALTKTPDAYTLQYLLGDCILEQTAQHGMLYAGAPYSEAEVVRLREALEWLQRSWATIKDTDVAPTSTHIASNAALILFVLGEYSTARTLIAEALARAPAEEPLLTMQARLALVDDDVQGARTALAALTTQSPDTLSIVRASILRAEGRMQDALALLEAFLGNALPSEERTIALCLAGEILWNFDAPHAEQRFATLFDRAHDGDPRPLLLAAQAAAENGHDEIADRYVQRARAIVDAGTNQREHLSLADTLMALGKYSEAVEIYARHVSVGHDTPSLRNYLRALHRLDQRQAIAGIAAVIPEQVKSKPFYQWQLASAAIAAGDFAAAAAHLERCIAAEPGRVMARLRWAQVQLRRGERRSVEEWLDLHPIDPVPLDVEELIFTGQLLAELDRVELAAAVFYHARRRFPNDERTHLGLLGVVMFRDSTSWGADPTVPIAVDTAFGLDDGHGLKTHYIIESLPHDQLRDPEISTSHPLAMNALGHRAGDELVTHDSAITTHTQRVVWVKHKYVHAVHEILGTFNTRFPKAQALVAVNFPDTEDPELKFAPIWKTLEDRSTRVREILKLYAERRLPIAALAGLLGASPMDAWRTLAADPNVTIHVCNGDDAERGAALAALERAEQKYLLDPVALLTFHLLAQAQVLLQLNGTVCITQSTLDLFRQAIAQLRAHSDGHSTVALRDGQRYLQEVSAAEIAREIGFMENIVSWASAHCQVVPAIPKQDVTPAQAETLTKVLGDEYLDCLFAANGGQMILVSDDLVLRQVAFSEFAVPGIWTQVVLMSAADRNLLSLSTYADCIVTLAQWRCAFTSISSEVLLELATQERMDADADRRFATISGLLQLNTNNIPSLLNVVIGFLRKLWPTDVAIDRKERLSYALLNGIDPACSPNCYVFLAALLVHGRRASLAPALVDWIWGWMNGHFLAAGLKDFVQKSQRMSEGVNSGAPVSRHDAIAMPTAVADGASDRAPGKNPARAERVSQPEPSQPPADRSEEKILLFSYGSNMLSTRLQQRAPSARARGIGQLRAHGLRWHKRSRDGSGKCDAQPTGRQEDVVWGVLYEVDRREKAGVDRAEGLGHGYNEKEVEIDTGNGLTKALMYVATNIDPSLRPKEAYKAMVVAGAREHALPLEYVVRLESVEAISDPGSTPGAQVREGTGPTT